MTNLPEALAALCKQHGLARIETHSRANGTGHFDVFGGPNAAYIDSWNFALDGGALPTPEDAVARLAAHLEREKP